MVKRSAADWSNGLTEDFADMLLADVAASMRRYDVDQSEPAKRDMIRTLFAAIEGYIWLYREHVIEAARSMDGLKAEEEVALSELSYQVTEQGNIVEQPRFLSMLATFRITTRIAGRLSPDAKIRFDTGEWDRLRSAIAIRNRITHPKRQTDLEISAQDLSEVLSAFHWLLDAAIGIMETANAALRQYNTEFRTILAELRAGNPAVWASYRAAGPDHD